MTFKEKQRALFADLVQEYFDATDPKWTLRLERKIKCMVEAIL